MENPNILLETTSEIFDVDILDWNSRLPIGNPPIEKFEEIPFDNPEPISSGNFSQDNRVERKKIENEEENPIEPILNRSDLNSSDTEDPNSQLLEFNSQLADFGIAISNIEYFTIGQGRPSNRIHQQPFRWVPNDPRRVAQGVDLTYLVDQSDGATASGLSNADTEAAIDLSMDTWSNEKALRKVNLEKRVDDGSDPDIFDAFFGFGGVGNPFAADIVNAGWLPKEYFNEVGGSGGGDSILAFSVTFIFLDRPGGPPSDINGDGYLDTALNEVYYNDGFSWGIDSPLPHIDVETVALHENGHSLGLGHFGPPPRAVMNPVYAGINHDPDPVDLAGMNALYASWPNSGLPS